MHVTSIQRQMPLHDATLPYASAKDALRTDSNGFSNELARHGIRVNAVSPGGIETEAYEGFVDLLTQGNDLPREEAKQSIFDSLGGVPLGRFASAAEYVIDGATIPTI